MTKTLVCVLAETRAWQHSWASFKTNVLDALGADLALCIGLPEDYDFQNPFWVNACFRWTSPEYEDYGDGFDDIQSRLLPSEQRPDWRATLEVKNQWLGGIKGKGQQPGSGAILLYFRWILFENLRASGALEQYDRFVITRSDFIWACPHPPIELLSPDAIWFPDGENWGGYTDRHVVLARSDVELYLSLIRPIVTEPETIIGAMKGGSEWNIESYIKLHLERHGATTRVNVFPYVMYSVREAEGKTRWAKGVWNYKNRYYIKYPSEHAAAKFWQSAMKLLQDYRIILDILNGDKLFSVELKSLFGSSRRINICMTQSSVLSALVGDSNTPLQLIQTRSLENILLLDRRGHIMSINRRGALSNRLLWIRLRRASQVMAARGIPDWIGKLLGYRLVCLRDPAQG